MSTTEQVQPRSFLIVEAANRVCALPLAHVVETMRPRPIEPLGKMPAAVLGLALVRGVPTPVVDLRALFAAGAESLAPITRFVSVRGARRQVVLAVDAVRGVAAIDSELSALPPLLGATNAEAIDAIGALDSELVLVLRLAHVIPAEAVGLLDAGGA